MLLRFDLYNFFDNAHNINSIDIWNSGGFRYCAKNNFKEVKIGQLKLRQIKERKRILLMKQMYYVGINTKRGVQYVTDMIDNAPIWNTTGTPMSMSQENAAKTTEALCLAGHKAFVASTPTEIEQQPVQLPYVVGFQRQLSDENPLYICVTDELSKNEIQELDANIQDRIEEYGNTHDEDFENIDFHDIVMEVLFKMGIQGCIMKSDVSIMY